VSFWCDKLSASHNPRDMWSTVVRHSVQVSASATALVPMNFPVSFWTRSNGSNPPFLDHYRRNTVPFRYGVSFTEFMLLTSDDVATAVAGLPDKSSVIDPTPVRAGAQGCMSPICSVFDVHVQPLAVISFSPAANSAATGLTR